MVHKIHYTTVYEIGMILHSIKVLDSNYVWLIEIEQGVIVIDPGEAKPVIDFIEHLQKPLLGILLTHHHSDHTGGVAQIKAKYASCRVIGPQEITFPIDYILEPKDYTIHEFNLNIAIIYTPGHTKHHSAYLIDNYLFSGDCLFSMGCGKVFTNDYAAMYASLQKLAQLDNDVMLCAGHEYTLHNLKFALQSTAENSELYLELTTYQNKIKLLLDGGNSSMPAKFYNEKEMNLFLQAKTLAEFTALRMQKDKF